MGIHGKSKPHEAADNKETLESRGKIEQAAKQKKRHTSYLIKDTSFLKTQTQMLSGLKTKR